jgi:hypothetical protein
MKKSKEEPWKGPLPTPFEIHMISSEVREGRANPSDARRLLEMFCLLVDDGIQHPRWLLLHLRDSFRSYFDKESLSMESAFGLKRRKGRPKKSEQMQIEIAAEVVRRRLAGKPHQEALGLAAERYDCAESVAGQAFSAYRLSAVLAVKRERANGFTDAEKSALNRILPKEAINNTGKIEV